ncbi:MAG: extracellular solute-binding protein [Candidatus Latescibacteria bacterium]|nr:extracellular solute-binding protein [Candidatus Latescibacterota bacterium]
MSETDARPRRTYGRVALLLGLGVLLLLAFALPEPQPRQYPERVPVRFWHMWSGEWKEVVDRIAARFNQSQDRYELIALSVPGASADQKFLLSVAGGDPPDCMAQWNQVIPAWADEALLVPLDSLMSASQWQGVQEVAYPVALKIGMYQGHLYGVTTGINVWACYYNPQQLEEEALDPQDFPRDLETLWDWGLRLSRTNSQGNLTRLGFLPQGLAMYAPLFGGGFYGGGQVVLDTPANRRALEYLAQCRRHYGFDQVVRFNASLNTGGLATEWPFISGQYSITVDGQWRVEQLARYAPELRYGTAPIPPPRGGVGQAGWSNGNFMIIPRGARQVQGAWEFIKFGSGIEQPERAAEFYTWGGWLPFTRLVAESPIYRAYVQKYPQFATFLEVLPSAQIKPTPPVPYQVFLWDMLQRADDYAMRGMKTPEQALQDLEREVAQEVARRRRLGG